MGKILPIRPKPGLFGIFKSVFIWTVNKMIRSLRPCSCPDHKSDSLMSGMRRTSFPREETCSLNICDPFFYLTKYWHLLPCIFYATFDLIFTMDLCVSAYSLFSWAAANEHDNVPPPISLHRELPMGSSLTIGSNRLSSSRSFFLLSNANMLL